MTQIRDEQRVPWRQPMTWELGLGCWRRLRAFTKGYEIEENSCVILARPRRSAQQVDGIFIFFWLSSMETKSIGTSREELNKVSPKSSNRDAALIYSPNIRIRQKS